MEKITFAVFADLHYDHIHDGAERLQNFITKVKDQQLDFVIQLGDFCVPKEENEFLLHMLLDIGKPIYHVIGNHDSDVVQRDEVMKFLNLDNGYYSFKKGNIKFIVLDTCFIKTNEGYEPYYKRNYNKTKDAYPVLPEEQLKWLENELTDSSDYYVIFSHHSFENEFAKRGVHNKAEATALINRINNTGRKVLLCINGHDHGDSLEKIGQTHYFGLNSMSYIWVGSEHEHFSYSEEIHQQYPFIKDLVLYKDGLYAIVTITEKGGINIEGINGHYQNVSPRELGLGDRWNGRSVLPIVTSLKID